jgi:hypothetical protein
MASTNAQPEPTADIEQDAYYNRHLDAEIGKRGDRWFSAATIGIAR